MNGFFYALIRSLGFTADATCCRIMFGPITEPWENFIDHRASIVTIDGERHFVDVGTGAPMPLAAISIEKEGQWQNTRGQEFCIRKSTEPGWYELWRRSGQKEDGSYELFHDLYFLDGRVQECDFMTPNFYMYMSRESLPHTRRMVSVKTETGFIDLANDVFTEVSNGVKTERKVPYEELLPLIQNTFKINVSEPLRRI